MVSVVKEGEGMRNLDAKRMIEFVNNRFTGSEYVKASEIIEMLEVGIVEDKAVTVDDQCPFDMAMKCNDHICAGCETSAEWFANNSKVDPDPILEVYDKYKDDAEGLSYVLDSWSAIKKYAYARGRK